MSLYLKQVKLLKFFRANHYRYKERVVSRGIHNILTLSDKNIEKYYQDLVDGKTEMLLQDITG